MRRQLYVYTTFPTVSSANSGSGVGNDFSQSSATVSKTLLKSLPQFVFGEPFFFYFQPHRRLNSESLVKRLQQINVEYNSSQQQRPLRNLVTGVHWDGYVLTDHRNVENEPNGLESISGSRNPEKFLRHNFSGYCMQNRKAYPS